MIFQKIYYKNKANNSNSYPRQSERTLIITKAISQNKKVSNPYFICHALTIDDNCDSIESVVCSSYKIITGLTTISLKNDLANCVFKISLARRVPS